MESLSNFIEYEMAKIKSPIQDSKSQKRQVEGLARAELLGRVQDGNVTLLDVLPYDEYEIGHLPGAINIPYETLAERLKEIPSDKEVLTYCRGPYCILAYEAISLLLREGFKARHLA